MPLMVCTDTTPAVWSDGSSAGKHFSFDCPQGSVVAGVYYAWSGLGLPRSWGTVLCGDGTKSSEVWGDATAPQFEDTTGPYNVLADIRCKQGYAAAGYRGTANTTGLTSIGPVCRKGEYSWRGEVDHCQHTVTGQCSPVSWLDGTVCTYRDSSNTAWCERIA